MEHMTDVSAPTSPRTVALTTFYGVCLDCPNPAQLVDFYHQLTGMKVTYRTDEYAGLAGDGGLAINFQRVENYQPPQWPDQAVPQQFHLDFTVHDLEAAQAWVFELGATMAATQPGGDRWRVFLDPAGHPFCLAVSG
jgi:catechol 2,3-dioxygenase-like lactoylglutathione lyase family enzyme